MEEKQLALLLTPPVSEHISPLWETLMEPMVNTVLRRAEAAGFSRCVVLVEQRYAALLEALPPSCALWYMGEGALAQEIDQAEKRLRQEVPTHACVILPWNMPLVSEKTLLQLAYESDGAVPSEESLVVTDRKSLSEANEVLRRQMADQFLEQGVDIPFPGQVVIGSGVRVAPGARILAGCVIQGETSIGADCEIGPNTIIKDCILGCQTAVKSSWLEKSQVGNRCTIGPFSQLRPDCIIGDEVKIGDFVELKNAVVGKGTSVAHLTYLGDCEIGEKCNFGCGVVTANYDGKQKHKTVIGDRAFIGCNTNLVSPVTLGEGVYTAAGVTVTKDVPAGALVMGRSRQQIKPGWADVHVAFKK